MCQIFFFLAVLPFKRNLITDIDTLTKKMGQILRKTIFQYHILEFKNEWKKCNKRNFGEIWKFNFLIFPVFSHYSNHYLQRILHWKKVMSSENNKNGPPKLKTDPIDTFSDVFIWNWKQQTWCHTFMKSIFTTIYFKTSNSSWKENW